MEIIYLVAGVVVGGIVVFLFLKLKSQKGQADAGKLLFEKESEFLTQKAEIEKQGLVWQERYNALKTEADEWKAELQAYREENKALNVRLENAKVQFKNQEEKLNEQKEELEKIQKKL
ncbi:MAG TPA: hypothetical protein VEP89_06180, partial [Draconibacterium sp.]|nr:hypothetical protein [Draconibacterium sp.]